MATIQAFGKIASIYNDLPTKSCWIAGGSMRSFLTGDRVKDIDIFSADPQNTLDAFKADTRFSKSVENEFIAHFYKDNLRYEVIKKYPFESQRQTIENFDFTIICAAWGPEGLTVDDRFYVDNAQKRLVVKSLPKPLSSMKRALKYAHKGYYLCPVNLSKILRAIQENHIDWNAPDQNEIDFYPDGTPTFRGLD